MQINAIFGKIMHTVAKLDCISELKKHTFKVWRHNLHEEMLAICQLVAQFPFVAMDTEFPGTLSSRQTKIWTETWTQIWTQIWAQTRTQTRIVTQIWTKSSQVHSRPHRHGCGHRHGQIHRYTDKDTDTDRDTDTLIRTQTQIEIQIHR